MAVATAKALIAHHGVELGLKRRDMAGHDEQPFDRDVVLGCNNAERPPGGVDLEPVALEAR